MVKLSIINAMILFLGAMVEVYCPTQFAFCKLYWLTWHRNRVCLSLMINRILCLILIHLTLCLDIITERISSTHQQNCLKQQWMTFFIAELEILYKFAYICHVSLLVFFVIMAVLCETFHVSHSVRSSFFLHFTHTCLLICT